MTPDELAAQLIAYLRKHELVALARSAKQLQEDLADWLAHHAGAGAGGAELGEWLMERKDVEDVFASDDELTAAIAAAAIAPIAARKPRVAKPVEPAPPAAKASEPARRMFRPIVRAITAADPPTSTRFGGAPYLDASESWPRCPRCRRSLRLFVQLELATLPAELAYPIATGLLQIFYCTSDCESACAAWRPFAQSVIARYLATIGANTPVPATDAHVLARWEPGELESAATASAGDKLAGAPRWIDGPRHPTCRQCKQPMTYVLQLASNGLCGHELGHAGIAHVFQCTTDPSEVAMAWETP